MPVYYARGAKKMIRVTARALVELTRLTRTHAARRILFSAKSGGCNGFQYSLEPMTELPEKLDEVVPMHGFDLVVDNKSMLHIMGTQIDWKDDFMGRRFEFSNPNAASTCGCGATFSL